MINQAKQWKTMKCDAKRWCGNLANEGSAPIQPPWVGRLKLPLFRYQINEIDFVVLGQGVVQL